MGRTVDLTLEAPLRALLDGKAKPPGALGRLDDLAVQLGMLQRSLRPVVTDPVILVFAGDHGAVASGASAYPSAITAAMVGLFLEGRAAINAVAAAVGARLVVVDAGVAAVLPARPGLIDAKVAAGTADFLHAPAMTRNQAALSMARAGGIVDGLADGGCTVLALGEMGIGNTASAVLLAHKVAGVALQAGRGAGQDAAGLARKQALLERAAGRTRERLGAVDALAEYGGFEIAMLVGAILRGAARGMCVVVDGVIVTAAVLVARGIEPGCLGACVFAHRSAEESHDAMLAALGAAPLMDLGMRLGEGTGAALAIPLLRAAALALAGMADLADLG